MDKETKLILWVTAISFIVIGGYKYYLKNIKKPPVNPFGPDENGNCPAGYGKVVMNCIQAPCPTLCEPLAEQQ